MIDRILGNWKTTVAGVGLGGAALYVLNSWHCQLPSGLAGWVAWGTVAGPVVLGMLAADPKKA